MSKKAKSASKPDGSEEVLESKKPSMGFVGKRVSKKQYRQLLSGITDPLTRGAMRRMYFDRPRDTSVPSYFKPEEKEVKRPLGARK